MKMLPNNVRPHALAETAQNVLGLNNVMHTLPVLSRRLSSAGSALMTPAKHVLFHVRQANLRLVLLESRAMLTPPVNLGQETLHPFQALHQQPNPVRGHLQILPTLHLLLQLNGQLMYRPQSLLAFPPATRRTNRRNSPQIIPL